MSTRKSVAAPIRVMIVDDSAVARQTIARVIANTPGLAVSGTASDPIFALRRMRDAWPDVIILDIEMPRMDGLSFLRQLMAERPTPVIMCSSVAEQGSKTALDALRAGAVTIIARPRANLRDFLAEAADDIVAAVRAAAVANLRPLSRTTMPPPP